MVVQWAVLHRKSRSESERALDQWASHFERVASIPHLDNELKNGSLSVGLESMVIRRYGGVAYALTASSSLAPFAPVSNMLPWSHCSRTNTLPRFAP